MSLPVETAKTYVQILKEELLAAMGCTEPIAIAYAASVLRTTLACEPTRIEAGLSGNIIKNVKSVIVPATGGQHGIEAAIAAGVVANRPDKRLEVLTTLREEDVPKIAAFRERCPITVSGLDTTCSFDLILRGYGETGEACVHIRNYHTNVILVEKNGEDRTADYWEKNEGSKYIRSNRSLLNVKDIVTFADEVDLSEVRELLTSQLRMNLAIAEEGLSGKYGANIGKILYRGGEASLKDRARAYAAAGSDARMSGCELPVCILSGSGNQGITASVPVAVYAKEMGASEDEMLRALLVSDLITIHQKEEIGCLSAYCGAISAGCAAGCGITYLKGGRYYEIAHALVNSVAILSGTVCDGAKASCAAKIAMAVEAGIMGYEMMQAGSQFYGGDGIITKGVENTLRNIGKLARNGMGETDKEIIRIMLE
ncbi:MAG: serine dehydratase subunit alpha family protein [Clostridia bacterium]|nr:serine dehydratase subunit alpha family protein [Clostridia bacterium]